MRIHFLIASFSAVSAPARRGGPAPHLTHHYLSSFLFRTNKPHRITILLRPLLKTKEKGFSIQYKFPLRDFALRTEPATSLLLRPELHRFLGSRTPNYLVPSIPLERGEAENCVC